MSDVLKGLFGGGSSDNDDSLAKLRDFARRYTDGDPNDGYDEDEAKENAARVLQSASSEVIQHAARQTFQNLPENQRSELAQMIEQRKQGAGLVDIQRTGESGATAGSHQSGGDPLSDLFGSVMGGGGGGLGGLLGGIMGGGGSSSSGGGLGGLLGGIMGGGDDDNDRSRSHSGASNSGGGGIQDVLSGVLSGPTGKVILGGIAAFAAQQMFDKK